METEEYKNTVFVYAAWINFSNIPLISQVILVCLQRAWVNLNSGADKVPGSANYDECEAKNGGYGIKIWNGKNKMLLAVRWKTE